MRQHATGCVLGRMKRLLAIWVFAAAMSCGGEDSTSNSTCNSTHECMNDVCQCTTSGKSGNSCEKDKCESQCEVCTSS